MLYTWLKTFVCIAAITLIEAAPAAAGPTESAAISGIAVTNAGGVIAVNQTAGNGNMQANVAVIGDAPSPIRQRSATTVPTETGSTFINGFAFSGATGIVQLNQSAGAGNAQANVVYVGDSALSATIPQQSVPAGAPSSNGANAISVSKTAFTHAQGIVQVNQTAGSSNCTANTFVLQLPSVAAH